MFLLFSIPKKIQKNKFLKQKEREEKERNNTKTAP